MTLEEALSLPERAFLAWVGVQVGRQMRMACPVCQEGRRDGRPPARLHGRAWTCNACHATGGRLDLLGLLHFGARWDALSGEQRALALGQPPPTVSLAPPPLVRLGAGWPLLKAQLTLEPSEAALAWFAARGLEVLPAGLYVGPESRHPSLRYRDAGDWREYGATGYEVLVPLLDGVHVQGANVRRVVPGSGPKARSLCGFDAVGLVMMDLESVRRARRQEEDARPVVCVEGVPDYLTACFLWPHYAVRGVLSGSEAGGEAGWLRALRGRRCLVLPHPDGAGARHAELWRREVDARVMELPRLAALAGVAARDKDDLNDLHLRTPNLHRLRIFA